MPTPRTYYQNLATGELDIAAVAAHAAAELAAIERGASVSPKALPVLADFLSQLESEGHASRRPIRHQLALALSSAFESSRASSHSTRTVSDVLREAATVAQELLSPDPNSRMPNLKAFCLALSRAAMSRAPNPSKDCGRIEIPVSG